jgi:hypothetical protein
MQFVRRLRVDGYANIGRRLQTNCIHATGTRVQDPDAKGAKVYTLRQSLALDGAVPMPAFEIAA